MKNRETKKGSTEMVLPFFAFTFLDKSFAVMLLQAQHEDSSGLHPTSP
jgi:hypothetical protein